MAQKAMQAIVARSYALLFRTLARRSNENFLFIVLDRMMPLNSPPRSCYTQAFSTEREFR